MPQTLGTADTLGDESVKGTKPMKRIIALALIELVTGPLVLSQTPSKEKAIDSVAVLPFVTVTHDRNTEYLADEITRKLINSLSMLPNLKIVPYTSVRKYKGLDQVDPHLEGKGKALNLETVRHELGVQAVLYGRLVQSGESLSISAELLNARDMSLIWGDQYNCKISDFLGVQKEMAHDISMKLRPWLTIDRKADRHSRKAKRVVHKVNPE